MSIQLQRWYAINSTLLWDPFKLTGLVLPEAGISILLVIDQDLGSYCCGSGYNGTSDTCGYPTHGSYAPFALPQAAIIYNRTSGSTTLPSAVTETARVTETQQLDFPQAKHVSATAVGIPLGIVLLISLALLAATLMMLMRSRTALKRLDRQMQENRESAERDAMIWRDSKKHHQPSHELNGHSPHEIGSSDTGGEVYEVGEDRMLG